MLSLFLLCRWRMWGTEVNEPSYCHINCGDQVIKRNEITSVEDSVAFYYCVNWLTNWWNSTILGGLFSDPLWLLSSFYFLTGWGGGGDSNMRLEDMAILQRNSFISTLFLFLSAFIKMEILRTCYVISIVLVRVIAETYVLGYKVSVIQNGKF